MMGRDHALTGACAFAAVAPLLPAPGGYLAAGIALTAGAGVLPDIDHPDSTVAQTFGFATAAFAWIVARISGGHRHGTHSLTGIAVFTAGAYAAGTYQAAAPAPGGHPGWCLNLVPAGVYLALLYSAAFRSLKIGSHHGDLLGMTAAAVTVWTGADLAPVASWHVPLLALATALGCAAHIAGDELTHGGCPLAWPLSRHEFHLLPEPFQITTNKWAEHWIVTPALLTGFAWLAWRDTGAAAALHGTPAALPPAARHH
jgi:membrane-bound metal-dependent hydrolase YbcI (DUF457 family)